MVRLGAPYSFIKASQFLDQNIDIKFAVVGSQPFCSLAALEIQLVEDFLAN